MTLVGLHGVPMNPEQIDAELAKRKEAWKPRPARYPKGVLRLFSEHAVSPMKGGYMEVEE